MDKTIPADESCEGAHRVEVFFDGDCPLCMREIRLLRRLDRENRIRFTDIAAADFDPSSYGKTQAEFMAQIQGRLHSGAWIQGVEVFRALYSEVGFKTLVQCSRAPVVRQILESSYRWFAKHRLRITGRCSAETCSVSDAEA
ncbi:MAG: DUF393 domain-containing protein [Myxococcota bacterium]